MRDLSPILLLLAPAPTAIAAESALVRLSEPMATWKRHIEERSGTPLLLARVFTDPVRNQLLLPDDALRRPALARFFLDAGFVAQFVATHAMTIRYRGPETSFDFVVLNMAKAAEWEGVEDALLAHEFGHAWLHALGYLSPADEPGAASCFSIHAGDIVQHILIRREIERRSISYLPYWTRNLDRALEQLELQGRAAQESSIPVCQRLAQLALWMDVRLGLSPDAWIGYRCFLQAMARNFPMLEAPAERLWEALNSVDPADRDAYARVLGRVTEILREVANPPP